MYKCPNPKCTRKPEEPPVFFADITTPGSEILNDAGEVIHTTHNHKSTRTSPVLCAKCVARAEWIDARQGELFPIAPTLDDVA